MNPSARLADLDHRWSDSFFFRYCLGIAGIIRLNPNFFVFWSMEPTQQQGCSIFMMYSLHFIWIRPHSSACRRNCSCHPESLKHSKAVASTRRPKTAVKDRNSSCDCLGNMEMDRDELAAIQDNGSAAATNGHSQQGLRLLEIVACCAAQNKPFNHSCFS